MTWNTAIAAMRGSLLDLYGQAVTLNGAAVTGVLEMPMRDESVGNQPARLSAPTLTVATADVTSSGAEPGDACIASGTTFKVVSIEAQDDGFSAITLRAYT